MLSRQEDDYERRATLENDLKVLEQQGSTFHRHAQSQADEVNQGRFAATGAPRIVGGSPGVAAMYPAAAPSHQVSLPPEEPLGYSIDQMPTEPSTVPPPFLLVEQLGEPVPEVAPSDALPDEQRADVGSPSSYQDDDHAA
jgi:hypothetical protein